MQLIGATDVKRRSGIYNLNDAVARRLAGQKLTRFSYDGLSNALTSSGTEECFDVSQDGINMFVAVRGTRLTAAIFQYAMSTPWDVSSLSYTGKTLVVGDYEPGVNAVCVSSDGLFLFFTGNTNDTIWRVTMSSAYDLATGSVDVKKLYLGGQDANPCTAKFSVNGGEMFVMGNSNDRAYQYLLGTAYDVSTGTLFAQSPVVTTQESTPTGLFVTPNKESLYIIGPTSDAVHAYSFGGGQTIASVFGTASYSVSSAEVTPRDLYLKDGVTLADYYVIGQTGDDISYFQYSSYINNSASLGEATPTGMWFKPDGTKLYIVGTTGKAVRQFSLNPAWDLASIALEKTLSVAFEANPTGVTLSADGTKLYITGLTNDCVYQIPLSVAWDIGSALGFLYIGGTEASVRGIDVSGDGSLLFIAGDSNNVRKYTMTTPHQVSTATLSQSFAVTGVYSVDVSEDGRLMYVTTDSTGALGGRHVRQVSMTTPNDLSTASLSATEILPIIGLTGASVTPWAARISSDGTRMFVLSDVVQGLYQFSLRF